jgi:hypothetical protein
VAAPPGIVLIDEIVFHIAYCKSHANENSVKKTAFAVRKSRKQVEKS